MSNQVYLQRTVFTNYGETQSTFGFRMYDDISQAYDNTLDEADLKLPDDQFLRLVRDRGCEACDVMLDYLLDNYSNGIYIDGDWKPVEWAMTALKEESSDDDEEQLRRDEKNGLYGGKVDPAN